jgi:protein-tyrosine phosphatase
LLNAGVQTFVDLTTPDDGLTSYDPILRQLPLGALAERIHMPIPDLRVCGDQQMRRILDAIDSALDTGQTVYVHCWGGVGRTGTVIGCWLVRHGRSGQEALAEVAELYGSMSEAKRRKHPHSPETEAQRRMIARWETIERRAPAPGC